MNFCNHTLHCISKLKSSVCLAALCVAQSVVLLCYCATSTADETAADSTEETQLPVYVGYTATDGIWGARGIYGYYHRNGSCPKGSAYYSQRRLGNPDRAGKYVALYGDCIELPHDALRDEHVYALESCPDGYLATGIRPAPVSAKLFSFCTRHGETKKCDDELFTVLYDMRCTKINTTRYQLGEERSLSHWGWPRHLSDYRQNIIPRENIPVALRYAIGRLTRYTWELDGCIATPYGSILTKKTGRRCNEFYSRQLQYTGINGDPARGTPVPLFAECLTLSDRFSTNPRCVARKSSQQ